MEDQEKMYRTFYGSTTSNSCAYCFKHYKALTPKQLKKRKCLEKQCSALQRCEHPYWEMRDKRKQMRVERKERLETKYREVTGNGVHSEETSGTCSEVLI